MTNYSFNLPIPPSDNSLYANRNKPRKGQRGRRLSDQARNWKDSAGILLLSQRFRRVPSGMFFGIDSTVVFGASGRRPDLSNCYKLLIDTIAEVIGVDDKFLIEDLRRLEISDVPEPFIWGEVRIWNSYLDTKSYPLRANGIILGKAKVYDL